MAIKSQRFYKERTHLLRESLFCLLIFVWMSISIVALMTVGTDAIILYISVPPLALIPIFAAISIYYGLKMRRQSVMTSVAVILGLLLSPLYIAWFSLTWLSGLENMATASIQKPLYQHDTIELSGREATESLVRNIAFSTSLKVVTKSHKQPSKYIETVALKGAECQQEKISLTSKLVLKGVFGDCLHRRVVERPKQALVVKIIERHPYTSSFIYDFFVRSEDFDSHYYKNRFRGDFGWITELHERYNGMEKLLGTMSAARPKRRFVYWPKLTELRQKNPYGLALETQAWVLVSHSLGASFKAMPKDADFMKLLDVAEARLFDKEKSERQVARLAYTTALGKLKDEYRRTGKDWQPIQKRIAVTAEKIYDQDVGQSCHKLRGDCAFIHQYLFSEMKEKDIEKMLVHKIAWEAVTGSVLRQRIAHRVLYDSLQYFNKIKHALPVDMVLLAKKALQNEKDKSKWLKPYGISYSAASQLRKTVFRVIVETAL